MQSQAGLHAVCITGLVGFTTAHDRDRLERLARRLRRGGFLPGDAQPIADMVNDADERLFRAITTDPSYVLRQMLPKPKHTCYDLRPRAHDYELPVKDEHNFRSRMLCKNIYYSK